MANRWNEQELKFLVDNHKKMSYAKMSNHLGRDLAGLIAKCRRLGLQKDEAKNGFKRGEKTSKKNIKNTGDIINIWRNNKHIPHIKLDNGEWVSLARKIWTESNGEIPKGFCIVHKDDNSLNCELDNLKIIKRGEFNRKLNVKYTFQEILDNQNLLIDPKKIITIQVTPEIVVNLEAHKVMNYIQNYTLSNN